MMITNPTYWTWNKEIPESVCDAIIAEGKKMQSESAIVGHGAGDGLVNTELRDSKVAWFPASSWVGAITWHYMFKANEQAWNFNITHQENPQFTIYEPDQFYDYHCDESVIRDGQRKLSLVITITDPKDYTGGEFDFEGVEEKPDIAARGSIIVFPSHLRHRANKVISGTRYSLVNWFTGPSFK